MSTSSHGRPSFTRLIAIVAIVIALALSLKLGRQAMVVYRLRCEETRLQQSVAKEKAKAAALKDRKAYIQSDAFVEEWARTVAKLTKPGEVRVAILRDGRQPAESLWSVLKAHQPQEEEMLPCWRRWWKLFFGPS